jgi:hypothetical protein
VIVTLACSFVTVSLGYKHTLDGSHDRVDCRSVHMPFAVARPSRRVVVPPPSFFCQFEALSPSYQCASVSWVVGLLAHLASSATPASSSSSHMPRRATPSREDSAGQEWSGIAMRALDVQWDSKRPNATVRRKSARGGNSSDSTASDDSAPAPVSLRVAFADDGADVDVDADLGLGAAVAGASASRSGDIGGGSSVRGGSGSRVDGANGGSGGGGSGGGDGDGGGGGGGGGGGDIDGSSSTKLTRYGDAADRAPLSLNDAPVVASSRRTLRRDSLRRVAVYLCGFGSVYLIAMLNPEGFIVMLEVFSSFFLNLGGSSLSVLCVCSLPSKNQPVVCVTEVGVFGAIMLWNTRFDMPEVEDADPGGVTAHLVGSA